MAKNTTPKQYDLHKKEIRDVILKRLDELKITRYQLAHSGQVDAAPATIFRFLNGETHSLAPIIQQMLVAVGLNLSLTVETPNWIKKAQAAVA